MSSSDLTPGDYRVRLDDDACKAADAVIRGLYLEDDEAAALRRALSDATPLPAAAPATEPFRLWYVSDVTVVARSEWEAVETFLLHRGAWEDAGDLHLGDLSRKGEDGWLLTRPSPFEPETDEQRAWLARQTEPSAHDPE